MAALLFMIVLGVPFTGTSARGVQRLSGSATLSMQKSGGIREKSAESGFAIG